MRLNWTNELQASRPGLVLGPQGKEALFPSGLLNWQDVILELPGPSWLPGEESEANTEEALREQE